MSNIQTGWCLIPPYIIANRDLSANEKLIFGRIMGLVGKNGYCWASNFWLGEQIGIEEKTVANIISSLKNKNLIETKVFRDDRVRITKRHIFVRNFPIQGIGVPAIGNSTSRNNDSYSVESSVEFSNESTTSDKLQEITQLRKQKQSLKRSSGFGNYPAKSKYPERREKKGSHAEDII